MDENSTSIDSEKTIGNWMGKILLRREIIVAIATLIIFLAFSITARQWFTYNSIYSIITTASELGLVAIGVSILIISGEFDLSVGSVYVVVPMVLILLINAGLNTFIALLISMLTASFIGFLNGILTVKANIPSFITTLGTMMFWRGIVHATMEGFPLMYTGNPLLIKILNSRITGSFRTSILWFIGLLLFFTILLDFTVYGNWIYATGGDKRIAREVGINASKVKIINFMIVSIMSGFAGITGLARFGIVSPELGSGLELEAIAATVVGGTLLTGGFGSVLGAGLGSILIAMISCGLVQSGAPTYWYQTFVGVILIIAVVMNLNLKSVTRLKI